MTRALHHLDHRTYTCDFWLKLYAHSPNINMHYIIIFNYNFYRLFVAFRTNKYCDEHLRIDNEPTEQMRTTPKMVRTKKGDPIAEARIQNEQSFTHLKIIKSSDRDEQPEEGKSLSPTNPDERPKKQKNSRIYSQVNNYRRRLKD